MEFFIKNIYYHPTIYLSAKKKREREREKERENIMRLEKIKHKDLRIDFFTDFKLNIPRKWTENTSDIMAKGSADDR